MSSLHDHVITGINYTSNLVANGRVGAEGEGRGGEGGGSKALVCGWRGGGRGGGGKVVGGRWAWGVIESLAPTILKRGRDLQPSLLLVDKVTTVKKER